MMSLENEIGPRLKIDELRERTVVIVTRKDRASFATLWVEGIFPNYVVFLSGVTKTYFLVKRLPDGKMVDDTGAEIQAF